MKVAVVITGLLLLLVANLLVMYRSSFARYMPNEGFQVASSTTTVASTGTMPGLVPPMPSMPPLPGMPGMPPMAMKDMIGNPMTEAGVAMMGPTLSAPTLSAPTLSAPTGGNSTYPNAATKEAFTSYFLENGAGAKDAYEPMGAYDGVQLPTGNSTSVWRYTAPNEKLLGDEFQPGPDSLFMFKNNQCKPECCGASFSCGGGCVCTTPNQRQYLAGRGGNRTSPEDSA